MRGVIGGSFAANSGSQRAMLSSSPTAPRSTNVMNVAAVSHFVDDPTDNGVEPDTLPTACSWITSPSKSTMRTIPPESPAARTRSASRPSVASNAPGANTFRTGGFVVVVAGGAALGGGVATAIGAVGTVGATPDDVAVDPDEPQPATNAAATKITAPPASRPTR